MLTDLVSTISNSQVFVLKMWVAFANAKATHIFFSKNISVFTIFNDQSFNDTLTNDIVSFEQLGPWCQTWMQDKQILKRMTTKSNDTLRKTENSWSANLATISQTGHSDPHSAPASPIQRGGPPLLPFPAAPLSLCLTSTYLHLPVMCQAPLEHTRTVAMNTLKKKRQTSNPTFWWKFH